MGDLTPSRITDFGRQRTKTVMAWGQMNYSFPFLKSKHYRATARCVQLAPAENTLGTLFAHPSVQRKRCSKSNTRENTTLPLIVLIHYITMICNLHSSHQQCTPFVIPFQLWLANFPGFGESHNKENS